MLPDRGGSAPVPPGNLRKVAGLGNRHGLSAYGRQGDSEFWPALFCGELDMRNRVGYIGRLFIAGWSSW